MPVGAGAEEPRHVRKKIPLEGLETVRFEVPTAHVRFVRAPGDDVRLDLSLECVGELIACGKAVRQIRIVTDRQGASATIRFEGPEGFEKKLRSDQRRQKAGGKGRQTKPLEGNYDTRSRNWGKFWEWSWRKPKAGDWAAATTLTIRYPMKAALEVSAHDADIEIHDLQVSAQVDMNRGSFFSGIAEGNAGTIGLEVKRGESNILDRTNRRIGTSPERKRLEWKGPGDKAHLEVRLKYGSAQVRLH